MINFVLTIYDAVKIDVWFKRERFVKVTEHHHYPSHCKTLISRTRGLRFHIRDVDNNQNVGFITLLAQSTPEENLLEG